ncbi:lipopolysaccharide biosynthesis protein [Hamadaea tsunoensis]|uniref:lipopolysaccharide biosynthesis protein n=1 Tax=Hamadaea tsunoensis TaxID=53368 RepID=UPI00040B0BBD|nr:lipopolysaccharide biosynthesis protein [Hamadaea tsunoensis]
MTMTHDHPSDRPEGEATVPAPAARGSIGVLKAGALSMLALVAVGLTRLVHGSLVSHATDHETYGLVGTMLATTMIASLVLPGGVSSAYSKFVAFHRGAGDPAAAWAVHRFLGRLGLVSSVVLGAGAAWAAAELYDLRPADALAVALLTAAYSLYTVDKAAMYGHGLVPQYARLELCTSGLAVAGTIVIVVTGATQYLLPLAIGYLAFVVLARVQLRRHRRNSHTGGTGPFDRRQVVVFTILGSIGTLASAGFLQATQLLADRFAEPDEVAHFVAAVALVAPLYFLPRAMALALFPAMAGAQGAGDHAAIRRQVDLSTRGLAALLTPVFVVGLLAAPLILTIFGGSGYARGAGVLRLMLCACFFGVLQVPAVNVLASGTPRQTRVPVASAVTGCLVGLGVVAVLGGPYGATGVGIGYLVGTCVTALIPLSAVWRIHRMSWFGPLAKSIAAVAVTGVLTTLPVLQSTLWGPVAAAVGAVLAGVLFLGEIKGLVAQVRSGARRSGPAAVIPAQRQRAGIVSHRAPSSRRIRRD